MRTSAWAFSPLAILSTRTWRREGWCTGDAGSQFSEPPLPACVDWGDGKSSRKGWSVLHHCIEDTMQSIESVVEFRLAF